MNPVLTPEQHGYIDYATVVTLLAVPYGMAFSELPSTICAVTALGLLMVSLFTRYPLGIFKLVPFTWHGAMELVASPLLMAMPWIAGFQYEFAARNFFLIAGAALFGVWAFTNYRAADFEENQTLFRGGRHAFNRN